jgi:fumarate reductase flavoprotein subunit
MENGGSDRMKDISRRGFLGGAALGSLGAVAALAGCNASQQSDNGSAGTSSGAVPATWDREAEVVIVGGGGTGLAAAVEATQKGSRSVLVIEKTSNSGGCTAISGGVVQAAGTRFQKELTEFQDDTPDKHFEYWKLAGEGNIDEELVRDLANNAPNHVEWLAEQGIVYNEVYGANQIPYVPDDLMAYRIHNPAPPEGGGGGAIHAAALRATADANGVEFLFDTTATSLIFDPGKGVIGVSAESSGKTISVKAARGVILATSSIDHDEELSKALSRQHYYETQHGACRSPDSNTGDGIKMALRLGAGLAGFGGTVTLISGSAGTGSPYPKPPQLIINGAGRRFFCEDATYAYGARACYQQATEFGRDCFIVFGKSATEAPAEGSWTNPETLQKALDDGTLSTADTIGDLATGIGVDAEKLQATIDEWNRDIATYGEDRAFGRDSGLLPCEAPYYYQPVVFGSNLGAIGGVRIDVSAQVIDTEGNPIARLFAGGMCSGGWIGSYYPGSGTAVMGTVHWGRKAANSVLALEPWS